MQDRQQEAETLFLMLWEKAIPPLKKSGWIDNVSEIAYCDIGRLLGFAPHDNRSFCHAGVAQQSAFSRNVSRWTEVQGMMEGSNLFLLEEGWFIFSDGQLVSATLFLLELKKEA